MSAENTSHRVFITQLIYIHPGSESVFDEFEAMANPLIARYRGELLLRCRPAAESMLEGRIGLPYEIHLVAFESEPDFQAFMENGERKKFLNLKEQSIRSSILIKGLRIGK